MRYLTALAAAIALLTIAAGCGGGGDGSGSSSGADGTNASAAGDAASAAANEACAAANEEIAALTIPDNSHAVLVYLERTEATVAQLHEEVAGLEGSGIAEYADALATSVTVLNEMANAARSRNPDEVRELSKRLEELHLGKVAAAAGLETCAEAPGVES